MSFIGAFGQAYKYGTDEQKKKLKKLSEDYSEKLRNIEETSRILVDGKEATRIFAPLEKKELLGETLHKLHEITDHEKGRAPKIW